MSYRLATGSALCFFFSFGNRECNRHDVVWQQGAQRARCRLATGTARRALPFGDRECGLSPSVCGVWRGDYHARVIEAFLTAFHHREKLCWSTPGRLSEELWERFGILAAEMDAGLLQNLMVKLAALPVTKQPSSPFLGAEVVKLVNGLNQAKWKPLLNAFKQHTKPFTPQALPERHAATFAPSVKMWTEHWDRYESPHLWPFIGRSDDAAVAQVEAFDSLDEEAQEKLAEEMTKLLDEDQDLMMQSGCTFEGCCYRKREDGTQDLRPSLGYRCPYAAARGEVRMVCGVHFQLAWAAKKLCELSEEQYKRYFFKLLDFVQLTKTCSGPNCMNVDPPFIS